MNPFPKTGTVGKIGDIIIDAGKLKVPDLSKLFPTCGSQFTDGLLPLKKGATIPATIAMIPHGDSQFNTTSLPDTAVTFRAVGDAVKKQAADWGITVPPKTIGYTTFSKALFLGEERGAILFITSAKTSPLYLQTPGATHVWSSDVSMVYCKKSKLFVLEGTGYSMYIDFGI